MQNPFSLEFLVHDKEDLLQHNFCLTLNQPFITFLCLGYGFCNIVWALLIESSFIDAHTFSSIVDIGTPC
jgi:hypothetical protein